MTKKEASIILNINPKRIKNLIINKKLNTDMNNKLIPDSVYEYKKELDLRRSLSKPVWVSTGGNST